MHLSKGRREDGIVVGNTYDKYGTRNPIARYLVNGFSRSLEALVERTGAGDIHEVGCGEGYWVLRWQRADRRVRGSDFSTQAIELARTNAREAGVDPELRVASIYDLSSPEDAAELVVCCEVMEHLEEPERALSVLAKLASPHLIVSVPREPGWSWMNLARGKYWRDFGNTPGHIQRWSKRRYLELLSKYVDIVEVRTPLPWTMALCRRR